MVFLITSGAIREWSSELADSSKGPVLKVSKTPAPNSRVFTEQEVDRKFLEGLPYSLEGP